MVAVSGLLAEMKKDMEVNVDSGLAERGGGDFQAGSR
jgi:hypothetical protein